MKPLIIKKEEIRLYKPPRDIRWTEFPSYSTTTKRYSREYILHVTIVAEQKHSVLFDWIGSFELGVLYTCQKYFAISHTDVLPDPNSTDIYHRTSNSQREDIISYLIRTHL